MEALPPLGPDMLKERRLIRPEILSHETLRPEILKQYALTGYDEMFSGGPSFQPDDVRPEYRTLLSRLRNIGVGELQRRHKLADLTMRNQGITFTDSACRRATSAATCTMPTNPPMQFWPATPGPRCT